MEKPIFAIRDKLVGYNDIITADNVDSARRGFVDACRNPFLGNNAGDFELVQVGVFDNRVGLISPFARPEFIMSGIDALAVLRGRSHNEE